MPARQPVSDNLAAALGWLVAHSQASPDELIPGPLELAGWKKHLFFEKIIGFLVEIEHYMFFSIIMLAHHPAFRWNILHSQQRQKQDDKPLLHPVQNHRCTNTGIH
jgi:hypothetical protein